MMKIINIIHYPINYSLKRNILPVIEWNNIKGEKIAIWDGNWSQILGNEILKVNKNIHYEIWRPDIRADKIYSYTYPNGLVYKLFPSNKIHYFSGLKKQTIFFSNQIIHEIQDLYQNTKDLILHLNAAYRYHDKLIIKKFNEFIPIIAQFYTNPNLTFEKNNPNNPINFTHRLIIKNQINDYYNMLNYIIPSTQKNLSIYENKYEIKVFYRKNIANYGIDFNIWDNNTSKIDARNILGLEPDIFMFFSSSRLVPEKQIDLMLIEFSKIKFKEFKIFLSGNGSLKYETYLKSLVKKFQLNDKVSFIGFVSEEELKLYYSATDVFLSTSKSEAGPMSTALAALYEIPIITTNTGLVYEFLINQKSGLYIDKDNFSLWHETFSNSIEGKENIICSKNAIIGFFDWDRITQYYIETYNAVLNDFNNKSKLSE